MATTPMFPFVPAPGASPLSLATNANFPSGVAATAIVPALFAELIPARRRNRGRCNQRDPQRYKRLRLEIRSLLRGPFRKKLRFANAVLEPRSSAGRGFTQDDCRVPFD